MSLSSAIFVRGFATSQNLNAAIKNVTIIGGGLMGSGIAQVRFSHLAHPYGFDFTKLNLLQVAAQAGNSVNLVEVNDNALQKAKSGIQTSLQRVAKKLYKVFNEKNFFPLVNFLSIYFFFSG